MSKKTVKAESLVEFLNQKYKSDVGFRQDGTIERKEVIFNEVSSLNEEEGTVECIITTQGVDRSGDIVISKGVNTDEFNKIPSVFLNHDYSILPIAKCVELVHKEGSISAKIKFALNVPLARDVYELVKAGVLKGVSIGFDASEVLLKGCKAFDEITKSMGMDLDTYKSAKRVITQWKLYEFSLVSVPANAECYVKSLGKGMSPELMKYLDVKITEDDEEQDEKKGEEEDEQTMKPAEHQEHEENETPAHEEEEHKDDEEELEEKEVSAEIIEGAKVEMEDHKDVLEALKALGIAEEKIQEIFQMIAADELRDDPNFYKSETMEEKEMSETTEPALVNKPLADESNEKGDWMPGGSFDACVLIMEKEGHSNESAKKICGKIEADHNAKSDKPKEEVEEKSLKDEDPTGMIIEVSDTEEVAKIPVVDVPQPQRYINIISTPDDTRELIKKSIEARLSGKTRLEIKIV